MRETESSRLASEERERERRREASTQLTLRTCGRCSACPCGGDRGDVGCILDASRSGVTPPVRRGPRSGVSCAAATRKREARDCGIRAVPYGPGRIAFTSCTDRAAR